MPFGLANAAATYPRLVAKALRHLLSSEVLCYLDDIAIHSADDWGHLQILRKVLAAFLAAGLQIFPEKAQLFQDCIKYFGHEVSAWGISIPLEYTLVIKDWPIPNTLKTLRAFLGKCGYYRLFIVDYASISAPLVQYTKQDQREGDLLQPPIALAMRANVFEQVMMQEIRRCNSCAMCDAICYLFHNVMITKLIFLSKVIRVFFCHSN